MAKMFYTLEEAAQKLSKSEDDVREMASSGRIQEFRDRDKLMFKVDQVNLLAEGAGDPEMSSMIPLAGELDDSITLADSAGGSAFPMDDAEIDSSAGSASGADIGSDISFESGSGELSLESGSFSGEALDLAGASGTGSGLGMGSGLSLGDSKGKSGISIFDADDLDDADPAAATLVTEGVDDDLMLDPVGSGSGLLDLTRESDDTSLGAVDFLEELADDEPTPASSSGGSALFESSTSAEAFGVAAPAVMAGGMVMAEPYDGAGSGLTAGLSLAAILALVLGLVYMLTFLVNAPLDGLTSVIADNFMVVIGALAGFTVVAGIVGLVLGKRS